MGKSGAPTPRSKRGLRKVDTGANSDCVGGGRGGLYRSLGLRSRDRPRQRRSGPDAHNDTALGGASRRPRGDIAWRKTEFKHFCNFVGAEGCAQLKCEGERENVVENSTFCFKDAWALSTSELRIFKNYRYSRTDFEFQWYAPNNEKPTYQITGSHGADLNMPPADNPYNFGRAAEAAWYDYLIPKADGELAQRGYINFYISPRSWARVGPGFLEFVDKEGNVSRCEASEIGSAKLDKGRFTLTRKDAARRFFGLFGSSGVFHFAFANLYNGRLFLYAFERLLGIKVQ